MIFFLNFVVNSKRKVERERKKKELLIFLLDGRKRKIGK